MFKPLPVLINYGNESKSAISFFLQGFFFFVNSGLDKALLHLNYLKKKNFYTQAETIQVLK
jgi:hypothetical protein